MKKRIYIAVIVDMMQTTVQHLASLCPRNRFFTLLLAVANSSLFTLHSSLFISCSSDETSEAPTVQHEIPVAVSSSAMFFEDGTEEQRAARRTWTPPTGYHFYSKLYEEETYVNMPNMGQSPIDLFMTQDDNEGACTSDKPLHVRLRYSPAPSPSTSQWKMVLPNDIKDENLVEQGDYYAYGFIPRDAADGAELRKLDESSTWAEGAILTINGLKSVASDPCVIIGAKHGPDADHDGGLTAGDFRFYLNRGENAPNYLYFLFDHLYSAFSISMRVNDDYHALRHIHLKAIYLRTETSSGATPSKQDVTIRLESNGSGSNPIVDITYDPPTLVEDKPTDHLIYSNSAGFPLTPTYSMFLGHFMPNSVSKFILTSVYDVYDTKDNLIRKDSRATNTLSISQLFKGQTESRRGWKYELMLTINPTYLYVMSDPDLNNPTVTVDN